MIGQRHSIQLLGLLIVFGLVLATDLLLRPHIYAGPATPDLPLLFLLWVAMIGQRRHAHLVLLAVSVLRSAQGLDGFFGSWIPAAVGIESVLVLRRAMVLAPLGRRLLVIIPSYAVALLVALAMSGPIAELPPTLAMRGVFFAFLFALGLLPILSALEPILFAGKGNA